jgi:hypothetical protein
MSLIRFATFGVIAVGLVRSTGLGGSQAARQDGDAAPRSKSSTTDSAIGLTPASAEAEELL